MVADANQLRGLADIAKRHSLPIISDEVFSEFLFGLDAFPRVADTDAPLVFTLNGFSKMFALPGMKLGWMAVASMLAIAMFDLPVAQLSTHARNGAAMGMAEREGFEPSMGF